MHKKSKPMIGGFRRLLSVLIGIGLISTCSVAERTGVLDVMIAPKDLDGGYWVAIYQDYLNANPDKYIYATIVDLDLDGNPELVAVKEAEKTWCIIADIIWIDQDGKMQILEYEDFQVDSALSLYIRDDGPEWVKKEETEYKGEAYLDYSRFIFSKSEGISDVPWLSMYSQYDYWEVEIPTNTDYTRMYFVNGEEVSYEDYRKEDMRRRNMNYIVTVQLCGYEYPAEWDSACSQYSVLHTQWKE